MLVSLAAHALPPLPPGEGHRPTQGEVAFLPKFCWAQFGAASGPEYTIPGVCGPGMNHYCFGLTEELRANRTFGNMKYKMGYLLAARSQTLYTINAMKNYPACPMRGHVEQTYARVNSLIRAFGGK
jgi:hypothetical protein